MLAEMINRVRYAGERFVVTRRGEEFAAFVSMEDLKTLEAMEEQGGKRRK
jgi:prevent-host-death family protein